MNAVTEQMPAPLVFTDSAANKVKQLIEEEGNPDLKLRVFVTGGGCSGFRYGFLGVSDGYVSIWLSGAIIFLIDVVMAIGCYALLRSGWKLKN